MMTFSFSVAHRSEPDRHSRSNWPFLACMTLLVVWTSTMTEMSLSLHAEDADSAADVADVPAEDLRAGKNDDQRYFLIGSKDDKDAPDAGRGLIVLMPGGGGTADFHPFVKRIYKNAIPAGYLVAQPVAISWTPMQKIVWPTKDNPADKMKFSTEEFVEAIIDDVSSRRRINRQRIFTLSWSSSGPAAYSISLTNKSVRGSFVAMSVFKPKFLPPLEGSKGHAYYIYHSRQDRVCPYAMAEQAAKELSKQDANTILTTYDGGHGWRGDLYGDIRQGIEWLEQNSQPQPKDN